ncbi:MAG TPA: aminoglycoside phosphotransferase family protein [Azonexus sp.]|nr:aminoglycoside phosphotransferase family protein [Azonexus sp.]
MKSDIQPRPEKFADAAIEQLRESLSDHFDGVGVALEGPISVRDNSEVFHATIDTAVPLEAAIKRCLLPQTKRPDEAAAKEQFVALQRVHTAFANRNRRYRVPTPLFLAPALGTLAMSWVAGESLTRKLRHPAVFIEGARWFEAIGAWLGNFHQAGPRRRRRVDLGQQLRVAEELRASPLPDRSFATALLTVQKTAPLLTDIEVEVSWLHGDCKTDNFILCGQDVYGIDISLCHENPVEYDLAMFLNNLGLILASPQHLHLLGMQSKLEKAFWRGYMSTGPSVSHAYLDWLRLVFSLSFWHTTLTDRKRNLRSWMLNRMFKKLVKRLSRKIALTAAGPEIHQS